MNFQMKNRRGERVSEKTLQRIDWRTSSPMFRRTEYFPGVKSGDAMYFSNWRPRRASFRVLLRVKGSVSLCVASTFEWLSRIERRDGSSSYYCSRFPGGWRDAPP